MLVSTEKKKRKAGQGDGQEIGLKERHCPRTCLNVEFPVDRIGCDEG